VHHLGDHHPEKPRTAGPLDPRTSRRTARSDRVGASSPTERSDKRVARVGSGSRLRFPGAGKEPHPAATGPDFAVRSTVLTPYRPSEPAGGEWRVHHRLSDRGKVE
jgi:hypothetical protein